MSNPKMWNLWHGCRKCSEGCDNCYVYFLDGKRGVPERSGEVTRIKDIGLPLAKDRYGRYKVPSGFSLRVNMASDTFIEDADEWRPEMWSIIRKRPDIIFYILTKRAHRIRDCLPEDWGDGYENVSLNISCENQRAFDERWPYLRDLPAKHKGMNLAPLIGPIDITPALESGQIEHVDLGGETFGGTRPCMYEWMERISRDCERYRVNFAINSVGSNFVKDGVSRDPGGFVSQARIAYSLDLSHFFGKEQYDLYSPYDGHLLSEKELYSPVFNKDRCFACTYMPTCTNGCTDCGNCKNVILVDKEGRTVRSENRTLDDFLRSEFQFLVPQVQQRDLAPVHEETELLVEEYRRDVVVLNHAVDDGGALLAPDAGALPQQLVSDGVPPHVGVDAHVLYPHHVLLVEHVVQHLGEDESHYLPVLLGDQAEPAVEVRLEVVAAARAQVVLPLLGEVLPLVLQRSCEVLADAGDLQLADGLHILQADGADLHLTSPPELPCPDSPARRP